jgi:hypothetical protein
MRNTATNYTFNISSVVGSWYLASTAVGVPISAEFYEVKVSTGAGSQSVASSGGGIQSTSGFAAVSNRSSYRLIRVSAGLYRLDVDPLPQLNPDEDEVLTVSLLAAAFTQCPPDGSAILGTIRLESVVDSTAATVQAVAVAASTAAVASSALGAAAALDAQSIAVIAMMSCARPLDRNLMGNVRLLSPLATSSTYEGMIAGNYILFGAVGLLQCAAIAVRRFVSKDSWQMSRMFARFPGFLFIAAVLVYQGTSLAAVKLVTMRTSAESTALGGLTLMFFFLLPFGTVFVVYRYVTAEFRQYDFKSFRDGKFAGPVRFIFPYGQWSPPKMTGAYGGLFADIRREGLVWVTLPFWGPTLMVIGAAFRPTDLDGCEIQFGTLAALQYLHFVFRVVTWPYRSVQSNVLSSLSALCIALILTGNTISVKHPSNEGAQTLIMVAVQAQTAVTILRIVLAIVSSQLENRLLGGANYTVTGRRVGAVKAMRKGKKTADDAEGGAVEEGRLGDHLFFGDAAMWGRELAEVDTSRRMDPLQDADPFRNIEPLLSAPTLQTGRNGPLDRGWPQENAVSDDTDSDLQLIFGHHSTGLLLPELPSSRHHAVEMTQRYPGGTVPPNSTLLDIPDPHGARDDSFLQGFSKDMTASRHYPTLLGLDTSLETSDAGVRLLEDPLRFSRSNQSTSSDASEPLWSSLDQSNPLGSFTHNGRTHAKMPELAQSATSPRTEAGRQDVPDPFSRIPPLPPSVPLKDEDESKWDDLL